MGSNKTYPKRLKFKTNLNNKAIGISFDIENISMRAYRSTIWMNCEQFIGGLTIGSSKSFIPTQQLLFYL